MLSLIKSILKSLELYFILKNKLFFFELTSGHEKNVKKSSKRLKKSGLMLATLIGLTSCGSSSSAKTDPLNIYQPSTLSLQSGTLVQTNRGIYIPQTDEIWHSDARFRKLERQIYFLSVK